MNCSKCSLEIKNENEQSPVCEECVREFWKQSRFGKGANEWGKRRNPITNKQQRFIATLYQDFKYDNCEFSIRLSHDDFYGHQIEINENILNCKCNSQCELLDKYRDVKKILPSNSAYASRTISFFLKMKKEISKKDIEKLTPKLLNSLWNPRKDNSNLTSSVNNLQSQPKKESWIDRLRKRKNGSRGIHEGSGGEPDNEEDHIEVPIQWPDILNYDISINLQKKRFQSNRFQNAKFEMNSNHRPKKSSGQFTTVYPCMIGQKKVALRVFTQERNDITQRYQELEQYFEENEIWKAVNEIIKFKIFDKELEVVTKRTDTHEKVEKKYPIIEMDWIEGISLDRFVGENIENPELIRGIANQFFDLINKFEALGMAHGDLHPRNILIDNNNNIKLVDYDCFFINKFSGKKSPESGDMDFQHPSRFNEKINYPNYDEKLDRFSALVIFLSLEILYKNPKIYDPINEESLLFSRKIFEELKENNFPELINQIKQIQDQRIQLLLDELIKVCESDKPIIRSLSEIIDNQ